MMQEYLNNCRKALWHLGKLYGLLGGSAQSERPLGKVIFATLDVMWTADEDDDQSWPTMPKTAH